jgi:hypothetical protein
MERREMEINSQDEIVNTLKEVGNYFRVSQPAVSKWKKAGMPIESNGSFNLRKITVWRSLRVAQQVEGLLPATIEGANGELTELKQELGRFRELVETYTGNRADIFAGAQAKLLSLAEQTAATITHKQLLGMNVKDKIKSLKDIVSCVTGLFTNERLERGESTENVAAIVRVIHEIKAKARRREQGGANGDAGNRDSVTG